MGSCGGIALAPLFIDWAHRRRVGAVAPRVLAGSGALDALASYYRRLSLGGFRGVSGEAVVGDPMKSFARNVSALATGPVLRIGCDQMNVCSIVASLSSPALLLAMACSPGTLGSSPAGFEISSSQTLRTHELGVSDEFTVVLTAEPEADVVVSLSLTDETEGTLNVDRLRFTPTNWGMRQVVRVTGVAEAGFDGDIEHELRMEVHSSDAAYAGIAIEPLLVTNEDFVVERVSVRAPNSGTSGRAGTLKTAVSDGGRQVVFESLDALVPEDTNGVEDVYLRDRDSGTTELLSNHRYGVWDEDLHGPTSGSDPAISADGRYVSFIAPAPPDRRADGRFAPGAWAQHVFVSDRHALHQPAARITEASAYPRQTALSADGRFVAFGGYSESFSPHSSRQPLRHDRLTGKTDEGITRVRFEEVPVETPGPAISADGSTILFVYLSMHVCLDDEASYVDDDALLYTTGLVEFDSGTGMQMFWSSTRADLYSKPALSGNGKTAVFSSNGDLIVVDLDAEPSVTRIVGRGESASLSSDGRFLTFQSDADFMETRGPNAAAILEVYVVDLHDEVIAKAHLDDLGRPVNEASAYGAISADGTAVSFSAGAGADTFGDPEYDAFVVELDAGFWHTAVDFPMIAIAPEGSGWVRSGELDNP